MAGIFIAIPTYNKQVDIEIMSMFAQLPGTYAGKHTFGFDFMQSSLLCYARNHLVRSFLNTDFEWMYFWDADVVIRDHTFIDKLLETAETLDAKVVGGLYRLKSNHGQYAGGMEGESDTQNLLEIKNFKVGEVLKPQLVDALATGAMLIHRDVPTKLPDPWFTIVDLPDGKVIPEDYHFCTNAKKAGFKIAADPRFDTFHFGTSFWQHHYEANKL